MTGMKRAVGASAGVIMVYVTALGMLGFPAIVVGTEIGHWTFNENNGTTIHDSSGNSHDGTITSPLMWSAPGYDSTGSCLQFPGYTSVRSASIPYSPALDFGGVMYLSAWVNPSGDFLTTSNILPLITKGSSTTAYALALVGDEAGDVGKGAMVKFQANYQTGGTPFSVASTATIPFGQWSNVAAAYDQNTVSLYINGALVTQQPMTIPIVNNSQPLYFGIDLPGFAERYEGIMDEVVISIPEPATMALLTFGVFGLLARRKHI